MTLEIICSSCGATLYSGLELKSARDILRTYGGKCRKCGVPLSYTEFELEVQKQPTLS